MTVIVISDGLIHFSKGSLSFEMFQILGRQHPIRKWLSPFAKRVGKLSGVSIYLIFLAILTLK